MENKNINRRNFLKAAGVGSLALGAAVACGRSESKAKATKGGSDFSGTEEMPMRTNPNTGDKVGILGYGCMRWQMIKNAEGKDIIDQESVNELVDYALEHGVNYFDSAPVYLQGQSERATALALLRHPRSSYYIATKASNQRSDATKESGIKMYKQSLANYETDYIDYYLLHTLSGYDAFKRRFLDNGLLDYFLKEREAGHIRNLGFSFHGDKEGFDALLATHETYHWDFVQIQMNYVDWHHPAGECDAEHMYNELTKRNIPVVIMEPLLGGQLSNVPSVVAEKLKEQEPEKSIASWAFRFVGSHPNVFCVLSGMTYMEHLQDNLETYLHFKPLNEEEFDLLESMASLLRSFPLVGCTGCQYCMPCPYGIDIPGIFKHYNDSLNGGFVAETVEQENYQKLRRRYLITYDKAIASVRQADHCIGCAQCVSKCPQKIRIPRELRRIAEYVENLRQRKDKEQS